MARTHQWLGVYATMRIFHLGWRLLSGSYTCARQHAKWLQDRHDAAGLAVRARMPCAWSKYHRQGPPYPIPSDSRRDPLVHCVTWQHPHCTCIARNVADGAFARALTPESLQQRCEHLFCTLTLPQPTLGWSTVTTAVPLATMPTQTRAHVRGGHTWRPITRVGHAERPVVARAGLLERLKGCDA